MRGRSRGMLQLKDSCSVGISAWENHPGIILDEGSKYVCSEVWLSVRYLDVVSAHVNQNSCSKGARLEGRLNR